MGILSRPIWYDEALSMLYSQRTPSEIIFSIVGNSQGVAANVHPPSYFLTLWAWTKLFGDSISAARMFSLVAGVLSVVVVFFFIDSLFGDAKLATACSLLFACAPFQVHYSQEIRMYGWMGLFLLCATYFFWKGMQSHKLKWWILFSLFAALAQYAQSLAAIYLLVLAASVLFTRNRQNIFAVLLSGIAAMILYLPWLLTIPSQFTKIQGSYWVEKPTIARIFTTLLSYVTGLPLPGLFLPVGLFISILVTSIAGWQTIQAIRNKQPGAIRAGWLLYLATVPAIVLFVISQWTPVFIERALLVCGGIFILWIAWSLIATKLPKIIQITSLSLLMIGFSIGNYEHVTYAGFPYGPFEEITNMIRKEMSADTIIIHSNKLSMIPAFYFDKTLSQIYIADQPGSSTDTLAPETRSVLEIPSSTNIQSAAGNRAHIFFVIFNKAIDESQTRGLATHPHIEWLNSNYTLINSRTNNELLILEYVK
jgi:4-amino-4-deoxy-L-arabinose transferase-like glycosyltransferase